MRLPWIGLICATALTASSVLSLALAGDTAASALSGEHALLAAAR